MASADAAGWEEAAACFRLRPDDKGRKAEQKPVGKKSQGQHQRRRPGQGGELPGPGTCLPVAHGAHLLPSYKHMKNAKG